MQFLNLIFALSVCAVTLSSRLEANERPNIILIIADDLAWDDSAPYGHPTIRTPNLTRMAATGMRFDRAFLTISSCSASRSSLITCKYPHRTNAEQLHWPLPENQVTFGITVVHNLFVCLSSHQVSEQNPNALINKVCSCRSSGSPRSWLSSLLRSRIQT